MCKGKERKGLYDLTFFVIDAHKEIPMILNKYVHSSINAGTINEKKSLAFQGGGQKHLHWDIHIKQTKNSPSFSPGITEQTKYAGAGENSTSSPVRFFLALEVLPK